MNATEYRSMLAQTLAATRGNLFPGTSFYWRYRTYWRLLSEEAARDYYNNQLDLVAAEGIRFATSEELAEAQAYDGLLELLHQRVCFGVVMKKLDYLLGKGDRYQWQEFEPNTFKGACEYLMAHKEPFERVINVEQMPPAEEQKQIVIDKNIWVVAEFDTLESPGLLCGGKFSTRPPCYAANNTQSRVVFPSSFQGKSAAAKRQFLLNLGRESTHAGKSYCSLPYTTLAPFNTNLLAQVSNRKQRAFQAYALGFCKRKDIDPLDKLLTAPFFEPSLMVMRDSAAKLIAAKVQKSAPLADGGVGRHHWTAGGSGNEDAEEEEAQEGAATEEESNAGGKSVIVSQHEVDALSDEAIEDALEYEYVSQLEADDAAEAIEAALGVEAAAELEDAAANAEELSAAAAEERSKLSAALELAAVEERKEDEEEAKANGEGEAPINNEEVDSPRIVRRASGAVELMEIEINAARDALGQDMVQPLPLVQPVQPAQPVAPALPVAPVQQQNLIDPVIGEVIVVEIVDDVALVDVVQEQAPVQEAADVPRRQQEESAFQNVYEQYERHLQDGADAVMSDAAAADEETKKKDGVQQVVARHRAKSVGTNVPTHHEELNNIYTYVPNGPDVQLSDEQRAAVLFRENARLQRSHPVQYMRQSAEVEDPDGDDTANQVPADRRESAVRQDSAEQVRNVAAQVAEQKLSKDKRMLELLWSQVHFQALKQEESGVGPSYTVDGAKIAWIAYINGADQTALTGGVVAAIENMDSEHQKTEMQRNDLPFPPDLVRRARFGVSAAGGQWSIDRLMDELGTTTTWTPFQYYQAYTEIRRGMSSNQVDVMQWLEEQLELLAKGDVKKSYAAVASGVGYLSSEALVLKIMVEQLQPRRPIRAANQREEEVQGRNYLTGSATTFFQHLMLTREMHHQRALRFENRIDRAFEGVRGEFPNHSAPRQIRSDPNWRMAKPLYSLCDSVKRPFSNYVPDGNRRLYGKDCTAKFDPASVRGPNVGLTTSTFLAELSRTEFTSVDSCCLSYVVNILLGFKYFTRTHDIMSVIYPDSDPKNFVGILRQGGVKLDASLTLCKFEDCFGEQQMKLQQRKRLNNWELANIQSNHLIAQLYFCLHTTSTHNMIAVHSITHGGPKQDRTVLHCYALVWCAGWHIITPRGSIRTLSFSRMQQTVPELEGATVVLLYSMRAFSRHVHPTSTALSEANEETKQFSIINRAYGAFLNAGLPGETFPQWRQKNTLYKAGLEAWLEDEIAKAPMGKVCSRAVRGRSENRDRTRKLTQLKAREPLQKRTVARPSQFSQTVPHEKADPGYRNPVQDGRKPGFFGPYQHARDGSNNDSDRTSSTGGFGRGGGRGGLGQQSREGSNNDEQQTGIILVTVAEANAAAAAQEEQKGGSEQPKKDEKQ